MLMEDNLKKARVNLDGFHFLDILIDEAKQTVIAELSVRNEDPVLIYAESFDMPGNYLRAAVKKGLTYLDCNSERIKENNAVKKVRQNFLLSG